jgi:DNA-binding transcriptional ArsR family regulator
MSDQSPPRARGGTGLPSPAPGWVDPCHDVVLTPERLRGLVHPVRIRLLRLLQVDGPATATGLAHRIGESSGVTSYHLRVLAEHGFIVEDTARGNGRDRWWRALHHATEFTFRVPGEFDPSDAETVELAEQYLHIAVEGYYQRMLGYVDGLAAAREESPSRPWQFSDWALRLSEGEARALAEEINALAARYRREPGDPDPQPGTVRAVLQFQLLPDEIAEPSS